jgi:hypothetical protein
MIIGGGILDEADGIVPAKVHYNGHESMPEELDKNVCQ